MAELTSPNKGASSWSMSNEFCMSPIANRVGNASPLGAGALISLERVATSVPGSLRGISCGALRPAMELDVTEPAASISASPDKYAVDVCSPIRKQSKREGASPQQSAHTSFFCDLQSVPSSPFGCHAGYMDILSPIANNTNISLSPTKNASSYSSPDKKNASSYASPDKKNASSYASPDKKAREFSQGVLTSPLKLGNPGHISPAKRTRTGFGGIGAALLNPWAPQISEASAPRPDERNEPMHAQQIGPEVRCEINNLLEITTSFESLSVSGIKCTTPTAKTSTELCKKSTAVADASIFNSNNAPNNSSNAPKKCSIQPLPKPSVDWLLGTVGQDEKTQWGRPWFAQDCHRRFRQLDVNNVGTLGTVELQDSLVAMFPTLNLDLISAEHHLPALHNRIPNLIATFDTDGGGRLGMADFIELMKFCQAWRSYFYCGAPQEIRPNTSNRKQKENSGPGIGGMGDSLSHSHSSSQISRRRSSFDTRMSSACDGEDGKDLARSSTDTVTLIDKKKRRLPKRSASSVVTKNLSSSLLSSDLSSSLQSSLESSRPSTGTSGTMGKSRGPFLDSSRGAFYSSFRESAAIPESTKCSKRCQSEALDRLLELESLQSTVREGLWSRSY